MIYWLRQVFNNFGLEADVENLGDEWELTLSKGKTDLSDAQLKEVFQKVEDIYHLTDCGDEYYRPSYQKITFDVDALMIRVVDTRFA